MLSRAGLSSVQLRLEVIGALRHAIGFEQWCWPTTDPGSALPLGGLGELAKWDLLPKMILIEQLRDPHNAVALLARSARPAATLQSQTAGDLARSARWDEVLRLWAIGDELRVALVDGNGVWGFVEALRESGDRPFSEEDVHLLIQIGPKLARALRLAEARASERTDDQVMALPAPPSGPGLVILDEELTMRSWTPAALAWLDALAPPGQRLMAEVMVYAVASRLLALRRGVATHAGNRIRARTPAGDYVVVESAELRGADEGAIAVVIRHATIDDVLGLRCLTHGLSRRETQLVELVVAGRDTQAASRELSISPYTVQDHLKSVFEKVGVRTRGQLTARLTQGTV